MLKYICTVTWTNSFNNAQTIITKDLSFSLITTALNKKSVSIVGSQLFNYDGSSNVYPQTITLTTSSSGVSVSGWYYKDSSNAWVSYPGSSAVPTLTVTPQDNSFYNDVATIRVETDDAAVYDVFSIYKIREGGSANIAFLSDEFITFNADSAGRVAITSKTIRVIGYSGNDHVLPRLGTITGNPSGMTVTVGDPEGYDMPLTIDIAPNSTLGGSGATSGTVLIPVTYPVAKTLSLQWVKLVNGYAVAVTNTDVTYQIGDSSTTKPTGTWDVEFPENVSAGTVVWTKALVEYADGSRMENYSNIQIGSLGPETTTGLIIDYVEDHFLRSHASEGITTSSAGWSSELVQPTAYMSYLWNYKTFHYTTGVTTVSEPEIICEYDEEAGDVSLITDYYVVTDDIEDPSLTWDITVPPLSSANAQLWHYVLVTFEDSSTTETDPSLATTYPESSRSIDTITEYYAASSSNTTQPAQWVQDEDAELATISNTTPYLWTYEVIAFNTANTQTGTQETYSNPKRVIAIYGDDEDERVSFSLVTPNGRTFVNGINTLTIKASARLGTSDVSLSGTYVWEAFSAGAWVPQDETGAVLTVAAPEYSGTLLYRCRFTYGRREYVDVVAISSEVSSMIVTAESSAGTVFKNGLGSSTLLARVREDAEVDEAGTAYQYSWYRVDSTGQGLDRGSAFAQTKAVAITADQVEEVTTFICEVFDLGAFIGRGAVTIRDEDDIIISPIEPANKTVDMYWLDTSLTAAGILKRWDGKQWVTTSVSQAQLLAILQRTVASNSSSITQLDDEIQLRVTTENYEKGLANSQNWVSQHYTTLTQTAEDIDLVYRQTTNYTDGYRTYVENYMRFDDNGIELGKSDSPFKTKLSNEKLAFTQDDEEVAYLDRNALYITNARMTSTLSMGDVDEGWFDWQMIGTGLGMKWKEPGVY